ncbi:hypothetical protein BDC45DRAFT_507339 [Circinella umbellata]|nr:hypothetical protein BDC45DRAFT_507339 [Circinella umbellata]
MQVISYIFFCHVKYLFFVYSLHVVSNTNLSSYMLFNWLYLILLRLFVYIIYFIITTILSLCQ